jgi:hypothetical protein
MYTKVKRPFGRYRRRRENNIKMYFKETVCESVDWIHSQGPVAGSYEHGNESWYSVKGGEFLD